MCLLHPIMPKVTIDITLKKIKSFACQKAPKIIEK